MAAVKPITITPKDYLIQELKSKDFKLFEYVTDLSNKINSLQNDINILQGILTKHGLS